MKRHWTRRNNPIVLQWRRLVASHRTIQKTSGHGTDHSWGYLRFVSRAASVSNFNTFHVINHFVHDFLFQLCEVLMSAYVVLPPGMLRLKPNKTNVHIVPVFFCVSRLITPFSYLSCSLIVSWTMCSSKNALCGGGQCLEYCHVQLGILFILTFPWHKYLFLLLGESIMLWSYWNFSYTGLSLRLKMYHSRFQRLLVTQSTKAS